MAQGIDGDERDQRLHLKNLKKNDYLDHPNVTRAYTFLFSRIIPN